MKVEFLGSGGAIRTPRPGCQCGVCVEARARGVPHSRSGPGVFVHGPDVLVDTSEDIYMQLNRTTLTHIPAAIYSHWHPDHTMGRRVWETMNLDALNWPPDSSITDIYLPEQVAADFKERLGGWEHLMYLQERLRVVRVHTVPDGEPILLYGVTVRPFRLAEAYVYAFILEQAGKRLLLAPDELFGWSPPADLGSLDLAVLPMGIPKRNPLTGAPIVADEHPIFSFEASYEQTLDMVRGIDADRVILTHIEERFGMRYDDFRTLEGQLQSEGLPVTFAYDTRVESV
ncbi:MAG: MBL fold metallo-hydrolase [Anaerolineae bacterium]